MAQGSGEKVIMDMDVVVPSPAGLGDPSPSGGQEKASSSENRACVQCSENASALKQMLLMLESERIAADDRATRMHRELQLVTSTLKGLEDELEELRSTISSSSLRASKSSKSANRANRGRATSGAVQLPYSRTPARSVSRDRHPKKDATKAGIRKRTQPNEISSKLIRLHACLRTT